jgi:hypothetical protein
MEKITNADIELAVILWTGWKKTPSPLRDNKIVIETFGEKRGGLLLEKIRHLEDDFYKSDANIKASNLAEMGSISSEQFRKLHPDLSAEIARAFAWCYTFDYK